jgi:hypothetical protein
MFTKFWTKYVLEPGDSLCGVHEVDTREIWNCQIKVGAICLTSEDKRETSTRIINEDLLPSISCRTNKVCIIHAIMLEHFVKLCHIW